jgi:hypothetical protein
LKKYAKIVRGKKYGWKKVREKKYEKNKYGEKIKGKKYPKKIRKKIRENNTRKIKGK